LEVAPPIPEVGMGAGDPNKIIIKKAPRGVDSHCAKPSGGMAFGLDSWE
jgi:hypothetical protein